MPVPDVSNEYLDLFQALHGPTPDERARVGFPLFGGPPSQVPPVTQPHSPPAPPVGVPAQGPPGWVSGFLRSIPPETPYVGGLAGGLAPMFEGPSLIERQRRHDEEQEAAARAAGANTPQEIARWRLRNPDVGPVAQDVAFSGSVFGISPNRLRGFHGVKRTGDPDVILDTGFARGRSDTGEAGTSIASDPLVSLRNFAHGQDPERMLVARSNLDPGQIRNLSPGEYSAAMLPELRPGNFPAVSKPQSYFAESEIFYPERSGGQASLVDRRRLNPQEEEYLARAESVRSDLVNDIAAYRNRVADLRTRNMTYHEAERLANAPPTPAEALRLIQRYARLATRYERPTLPHALAEQAEFPRIGNQARSFEMLFPEDMARLRGIDLRGQDLASMQLGQRALGERIAADVGANRNMPSEEITRAMGEQTDAYRRFVQGNEAYVRGIQDMPLPPVERIQQQLVMRDIIRNTVGAGQGAVSEAVEALVPEMLRLGFTQQQIRSMVREPGMVPLSRLPRAEIERGLLRRREVLDME